MGTWGIQNSVSVCVYILHFSCHFQTFPGIKGTMCLPGGKFILQLFLQRGFQCRRLLGLALNKLYPCFASWYFGNCWDACQMCRLELFECWCLESGHVLDIPTDLFRAPAPSKITSNADSEDSEDSEWVGSGLVFSPSKLFVKAHGRAESWSKPGGRAKEMLQTVCSLMLWQKSNMTCVRRTRRWWGPSRIPLFLFLPILPDAC